MSSTSKMPEEGTTQEPSFETSFERLEKILEELNSGRIPLERALALYEEANGLIIQCHRKLTDAERTIEILVRGRQGSLELGPDGQPQTQGWQPPVHGSKA